MRFSLKNKQVLKLRTNYLKKEELKVMTHHHGGVEQRTYSQIKVTRSPFGIAAIAFHDTANENILEGGETLDEIRFID